MAKIKVKIDEKALKRAVLKAADQAARSHAQELQKLVNRLSSTHSGRPVDEIKVALRSEWRKVTRDGDITDPQLTAWSTAISEGRKIDVKYDGLR